MSQRTVVECDVCGTAKKDTNHWFRIFDDPNGAFTCTRATPPVSPGLAHKDICGQACASKAFSTWLAGPLKVLSIEEQT
jgi:hypothetical protein